MNELYGSNGIVPGFTARDESGLVRVPRIFAKIFISPN